MEKFMDLFSIAIAYGQEGAAPKGPSLMDMLVLPLGFIVIMYFFIIRPQQRKAKEQASLITNLKSGDEVITTGGLIGRVKSVADTFVTIDIAANTAVKVMKSHISGLTKSKDAPAKS